MNPAKTIEQIASWILNCTPDSDTKIFIGWDKDHAWFITGKELRALAEAARTK